MAEVKVLSLLLGYLPIDKHGADLLFQIISQRYERAPMVISHYQSITPEPDQDPRQLELFPEPPSSTFDRRREI